MKRESFLAYLVSAFDTAAAVICIVLLLVAGTVHAEDGAAADGATKCIKVSDMFDQAKQAGVDIHVTTYDAADSAKIVNAIRQQDDSISGDAVRLIILGDGEMAAILVSRGECATALAKFPTPVAVMFIRSALGIAGDA